MRRLLAPAVLAVALATAFATAAPGTAATDPAVYTAHGEVLNVVPPGQRGNVGPKELLALGVTNLPTFVSTPRDPKGALATATPTTPANFADQLEMYDGLNKPDPRTLTDASLTGYFKDGRLGVPATDVASVETPRPGVTITRDRFGVPHIKGATFEDVQYGAGYANIEDRMFLTDILRHTGAARMVEFVGPTPGNLAMDQEQLQIAPYTEEQAEAQLEAIAAAYGDEGARLLRGLDAMIAGMNAAQARLCPLATPAVLPGMTGAGFGADCPVEYAALQKPPTPYRRADIVYIASLVGGIFGKGGGGEYGNALWLAKLREKYGESVARQVFDDLREKNDAEAPTTSPVPQPYGGGGVDPSRPGVALPDLHPAATAPGTGSDAGGSTIPVPLPGASPTYVVDGPFGPIDLSGGRGMSNALLVDAAHSATGHPLAVMGPQTGYYTPQLLVEQELDGPGVRARGVSFAGTNLVVELGHGVDYAWSATSASNDIVDTVIERLCDPAGGTATVQSTSYLVGTECVPMESYTHTETGVPNAAAQNPPETVNLRVLKTRHGVVQLRTTVGGAPVAVVVQRATYGHEVDSAVGFARLQDPGYVKDAASFQKAVHEIQYTFNWFYADDRDIAYFSSGRLPKRASGVDWDLPRWGDPAYDWRGFLPFEAHPRIVNPPTGYLVSWNNKPAPGFSAADNGWGYGAVYRSLALEDRVRALMAAGGVTRPGLVGAMMDAGTVDVRAAYLLPLVLDTVGTPADAGQAAAVALLRDWVASGAHRVDRDRDGAYEHQAAIALWDTWWEPLAKDVMRAGLGDLVDALPHGLDDHPRQGLGSSWNGVPWYGYVSKTLRSALGRPVKDAYSRAYCGPLDACRATLRTSLGTAVAAATDAQGAASVGDLTYDKHLDDIRHVTAGVVGVRAIDWQNRPTFQQVVAFTAHRPRTGAQALPSTPQVKGVKGSRTPRAPRAPLAATGGVAAWPAVLAAGAALTLRRRRRA
ncbi:MAG TPA: penicillin acylase family protein [Mycobacteriales bacterium]|nr:penicillin acylase family protein [Mycobacteriales bacterium]